MNTTTLEEVIAVAHEKGGPGIHLIASESTLDAALLQLNDKKVHAMPVFDTRAQIFAGQLSAHDVAAFLCGNYSGLSDPSKIGEILSKVEVREVVDYVQTEMFVPLLGTKPLREVVALLSGSVHRVPVSTEKMGTRMLSQLDLVRFFVQRQSPFLPSGLLEQPVSECCTLDGNRPLVGCLPEQRLIDAVALMVSARVGAIPVQDPTTGCLLGSLSARSICRLSVFDMAKIYGSVGAFLGLKSSKEEKYSFVVRPDQPLMYAINLMNSEQLHCLYVVDENHCPVGVVTLTDVIKAVAEYAENAHHHEKRNRLRDSIGTVFSTIATTVVGAVHASASSEGAQLNAEESEQPSQPETKATITTTATAGSSVEATTKTTGHSKEGRLIRWGILGTAWIATEVLGAMKAVPNAMPIAVGSRSLEKAVEFAKRHHIERAYGSYEKVLADPDVDAVYIPLPTSMHHEYVLKAAAAKKHVLCEKPTANNVAELDEMLQACRVHGVQYMDGTMWSHHTRTVEIEKRLLSESLGSVKRLQACFCWRQTDPHNIRLNPQLEPLGALGDLGWYTARAALLAFSQELPERVFGSMQRRVAAHQADGAQQDGEEGAIVSFDAIMWYSGGRSATFSVSFDSCEHQWFEIHGDDAVLRVDDFVWPWHRDQAPFTIERAGGKSQRFTVSPGPMPSHCYPMVHAFSNLIESGKFDSSWPALSRRTQVILDNLLKSATQGEVVEVKAS